MIEPRLLVEEEGEFKKTSSLIAVKRNSAEKDKEKSQWIVSQKKVINSEE